MVNFAGASGSNLMNDLNGLFAGVVEVGGWEFLGARRKFFSTAIVEPHLEAPVAVATGLDNER